MYTILPFPAASSISHFPFLRFLTCFYPLLASSCRFLLPLPFPGQQTYVLSLFPLRINEFSV